MSYREGIDTTPGGFPYRQAPHGYCGSNSDRQSVGDPGHCEDCCSVGHIVAHPDLGCADVGCYSDHVDEPVSVSPDPPGLPPVCATCGNPITHTGAGYRHVNPILDVVTGHESTPAQVAREQTAVHTNTSVTGITDEMIEAGARAVAAVDGGTWGDLPEDWQRDLATAVRAALGGALASRAVVDLPEPDAHDHAGNPIWNLTAAGNDVTVCVDEGQPMVSALSPCDPADLAEAYGLALIAGARAARQLAAEQASGVAGGGARHD